MKANKQEEAQKIHNLHSEITNRKSRLNLLNPNWSKTKCTHTIPSLANVNLFFSEAHFLYKMKIVNNICKAVSKAKKKKENSYFIAISINFLSKRNIFF